MGVFKAIKQRLGSLLSAATNSMAILTLPPPSADLRVQYGPDPLHFGDLRLPPRDGPHGVVVVVHGGFWRSMYSLEHIGHLCAALTAQDVATWNIEYRRIGDKGGAWPGTFLDVGAAVDYLRVLAPQHQLDLSRVAVVGHSAGGHLALWLAARQRIPLGDALYTPDPLPLHHAVSLAGVVDLRRGWELELSQGVVRDLMGGTPEEQPGRYATASPFELLPLGTPQILLHGTADPNVPYEISERYYKEAQAREDAVELVTLPDCGHFEVIDPNSSVWPEVRAAVVERL